jgi:hypothetical protein
MAAHLWCGIHASHNEHEDDEAALTPLAAIYADFSKGFLRPQRRPQTPMTPPVVGGFAALAGAGQIQSQQT